MRRNLYVAVAAIFAVIAFAIVATAETPSIGKMGSTTMADYPAAVTLIGKTPRTTAIHIDNVVRTLDNAVTTGGGTYLGGSDNTLTPIAATISCETSATMWAFQTTPSGTVGHKLAADGSWQMSGSNAIGYLKGIADGATDNVACAVTLWY